VRSAARDRGALSEFARMAGRYSGSHLDRLDGGRAVATRADTGQVSLVEQIPGKTTPQPVYWQLPAVNRGE
jgi:hypothetical protein